MRIVTYLGFTLLSILIQFSVIDFIQSIMQLEEKLIDTSNVTSQKRQLRDVFKDLNYKPHALYYRTQINKLAKDNVSAKIFDNTSLPELLTSTESTTGGFQVLYDDSTSATEEEEALFTTEAVYTSTEFDNATEITFFGNTNQTATKASVKPKKMGNKDCKCNFLYGACDINCCCDVDCSEVELAMFLNCYKKETKKLHRDDICYSHLFYFGQDSPITNILNDWFCIVKVNLPERPVKIKRMHAFTGNNFYIWKDIVKMEPQYQFTNKIYEYGDPIWLMKNESIYYVDIPIPGMNSYCTGRKNIQLLKEHKFSCNVKITDLEMFQIMKSSEEASVISATPLSMNSTYLNCSSLHCINWTLIVCENLICVNYNKSVHEPVCTESICTNLPLTLEYIFNYHDSKITNATIKFHVQNVSTNLHYVDQEIDVKFVLINESIEYVLKLSGNPGYIDNLPVIISYAESNHTDTFYNKSSLTKTYLTLIGNNDRTCVPSNLTDNFVLFGINRRIKCKYYYKYVKIQNSTQQCRNIQRSLNRLLGLKDKIVVSPLGDPKNLKDKEWIPMLKNVSEKFLYGELHESSKLYCYNIVTRYSFVFIFAEIDGNNRILDIKLDTTLRNASLTIDDISVVFTIDINFVDISKPSVIQYASGPGLNYYLPNDFFLPFPSNESRIVSINVFCLILYCCVAILASK